MRDGLGNYDVYIRDTSTGINNDLLRLVTLARIANTKDFIAFLGGAKSMEEIMLAREKARKDTKEEARGETR